MNNINSEQSDSEDNEILPEYDFTGGLRGKHYQAYRHGHSVTVHQEDGTEIVQHFTLEDGAIMLDPDVREYFPDAETVNQALRTLISLFPKTQQSITPQ
ncbi:hypothetical protein [Nodularia sp. NIES-3585]|uniref:hypothetical protein n=1 Tax=Nodularia sp. NIES-3585 TaxID=1973477 RepID=UPI000B5CDDBA|nr:hypothetical protein [Nodularia sp. NIES-3585]GAX36206.1 hypothetical protein NIES3585_22320 [Nodularia sp. NIES-3585]